MVKEAIVFEVLKRSGAFISDDHFVLKSGQHSSVYINKDTVYLRTKQTSALCRAIAKQFENDSIGAVIGPAIGGVILSQWTAHHLTEMCGYPVFSVYAEKEGIELVSSSYGPLLPKYKDKFVIRRGYSEYIAYQNVLVVEDVLTTGDSVKKVIEAVRAIGGKVVGLGALVNRGGILPQDVANVPKLVSLLNFKIDAWDEADCSLCEKNIPINTYFGSEK